MAKQPRIIGETAIGTESEQGVPLPDDGLAGATVREIGGRDGPDPTRYGDWEKNGRCIDF